MKFLKVFSFMSALGAAMSLAFGGEVSQTIDLDTWGSGTLNVPAADTYKLTFVGSTTTATFNKTGNGGVTLDDQSFGLTKWYWKGAGNLIANNCNIAISGNFGSYGNRNEQTNVFNNCTLTAGTFHNDCDRNRLHYGYTFFNGGTYTFDKLYVCSSDSGLGSGVFIQGGATVDVSTELYCVWLTSGDPGVARLVIEDGSLTVPQINLGWANHTLRHGAVELLGGTLKSKTIVNGPGTNDYVLADGGTYVVSAANTDALPAGIEHVYIGQSGLTLSTDYATTASKSFEPWTDSAAGVLTKAGTGTLTLTGDGSAHGKTVVSAGTLKFGAAVATHPSVEVMGGATLDLTVSKPVLAGLAFPADETRGMLAMAADATLEISGENGFDPSNLAKLTFVDYATPHTYEVVRVAGAAGDDAKAAWAAMPYDEVAEILTTFDTVYDEVSNTTTFRVVIVQDKTVKRQVTVTAGDGGSVDFENGKYVVDTVLTIEAVANQGHTFVGWTGAPAGQELDNPLVITVGAEDITLTANFQQTVSSGPLDLSQGDVSLSIGSGCTHTFTEVTGNSSANLTLSGGGRVVLPAGDLSSAFATLTIDGSLVEATDQKSLGAGSVTISNNGGIVFASGFTLSKTLTVVDSVRLGVVAGQKITMKPPQITYKNKLVTWVGEGTLELALNGSTGFSDAFKLVVDGGTVVSSRSSNTSSVFVWNENSTSGVEIEVHEGAVLNAIGAVPNLTLRGGTLTSTPFGYPTSKGDLINRLVYQSNNSPVMPYLNHKLTVLPSSDGSPSRITGHFAAFSQINNEPMVFDVADDAVLETDVVFERKLESATDCDYATVIKRGDGTWKMNCPVRAEGVCTIEAGEIVVPNGLVNGGDRFVFKSAGGVLRLRDTARIPVGSADDPLLSTAAVWFDPSRVGPASGNVTRYPNYGTQGSAASHWGLGDGAGTYAADVFNSRTAHHVNGAQGVIYKGYANESNAITVFTVARTTAWASSTACTASPVFIQDGLSASASKMFKFELTSATSYTVVFGSTKQVFANQGVAPGTYNTPFLNEAVWNGTEGSFRQYWSDDEEPIFWSGTVTAYPQGAHKLIALGAHTYSGGVYGGRQSGSMTGDIGETIVFNRALTEAERAYVRTYLQRKWFGSSVAQADLPADTERATLPLTVAVSEDEKGLVEFGTGDAKVEKTGEGVLTVTGAPTRPAEVVAGEGTVAFESGTWQTAADIWVDAADADSVTCAGGVVTAVANKGRCGGSFVPVATYSGAAGNPTLATDDAGHTHLVFNGAADLVLSSYVNDKPRAEKPLYVYGAFHRTTDVWDVGPFSFYDSTVAGADGSQGTFHYEESDYRGPFTRLKIDAGSADVYSYDRIAEHVPYLDVCHVMASGVFTAQASEDVPMTNCQRKVASLAEPTNRIDRVMLGGRSLNGLLYGKTQAGSKKDCGWQGKIGEFIVFSAPLSEKDERDLLNYLYDKWVAETRVVRQTPRVLGGADLATGAASKLKLTQKTGTTVVQNGPTVALAAYEAEEGATWARTMASVQGSPLFTVDGGVEIDGALSVVLTPYPQWSQPLMTYSGTADVQGATKSWPVLRKGVWTDNLVQHDETSKVITLGRRIGLTVIVR